jgi:hypothetical protein
MPESRPIAPPFLLRAIDGQTHPLICRQWTMRPKMEQRQLKEQPTLL